MFSAILGLAGNALSFASAQSEASYRAAMEQQEQQRLRSLQDMQIYLGSQAQDQMEEEYDYRREMEAYNRSLREQERQYQIDELEQYKKQLLSERQHEIDRQIAMDKEAARVQAWNLEQVSRNQEITEEEREFALEQLKQAQAIAEGERDDDMRRFYETRLTREAERNYMIGEFERARAEAQREQAIDLDLRRRLEAQIGSMQSELQAVYEDLGPVPTMAPFERADLDAEIARRQQQYQSDVDRAADRVASQAEAGLVRGGVDASTGGTAARAEMAARLADEYQTARARAYDEALGYMSGRYDLENRHIAAQLQNRDQILSEVVGVNTAGMEAMMNLPGYTSVSDMMRFAQMVPSAAYDRQIMSANSYRAPVPVNSALYDAVGTMSPGMSNYMVQPSAATAQGFAVQSSIFDPYSQSLQNPASYYQLAGTLGQSLLSNAATNSDQANALAYEAGESLGYAFDKFTKELQGSFGERATTPDSSRVVDSSYGSTPISDPYSITYMPPPQYTASPYYHPSYVPNTTSSYPQPSPPPYYQPGLTSPR